MDETDERFDRLKRAIAGKDSAEERARAVLELLNSEDRLLDALLQPIYIADVDTFEMLYMNKACQTLLGCRDYRGKKCYAVAQGLNSQCPFCTNEKLEMGKTYCWEHFNGMLGRTYQLQDNLIEYRGHRARVELVFDVSAHVDKEADLQTVLDAERQLVSAIQTVSGTGMIDQRLDAGLKICGEYFEADRSYIFIINGKGELDNLYEWCREGVEPQIALPLRYNYDKPEKPDISRV